MKTYIFLSLNAFLCRTTKGKWTSSRTFPIIMWSTTIQWSRWDRVCWSKEARYPEAGCTPITIITTVTTVTIAITTICRQALVADAHGARSVRLVSKMTVANVPSVKIWSSLVDPVVPNRHASCANVSRCVKTNSLAAWE